MAYVDNWDQDKAKLMNDIQTAENEKGAYSDSITAYADGWKKIDNTSDAMEAYVLLFVMMGDQGMDQLTNKTAVDAGGLQVQGDLTRLGNDIEDMTTQDDNTAGKGGYVDLVAQHTDAMIVILADPRISDPKTGIIGSEPANQLSSQYQIIRSQIYDKYDPNQPAPKIGDTWYFDPDANVDPSKAGPTDKMNSYGQLHDALGLRGDPYSANEAQKGMTNAFNENTSTTQSTNAASQEMISNDQNNAKGVQSFIVAGLHSVTDVESAAIKAIGRG